MMQSKCRVTSEGSNQTTLGSHLYFIYVPVRLISPSSKWLVSLRILPAVCQSTALGTNIHVN